jgi:hypothetical protein
MEAVADVVAFASGRVHSIEDKSINEYTAGIRPLIDNVGVVGWSAGGLLAILTMAQHGDRFPGLKWYASWESPVLSPVDGGWGSIFQLNPFYDPATGKVNFDGLRYSTDMPLWVWPAQGLPREPNWPRGGLYLDGDRNGRFNKDADYAFWALYLPLHVGEPRKLIYTPTVTREARDRSIFGDHWPAYIASVEEVEERASRDDALRHIPQVVRRFPRLAVLVFESSVGHLTAAPDHPHAIAQVNAWLDAGARWVRFNPDVHYVEWAMGKKTSRGVQYPAGRHLDRKHVSDFLEPEGNQGGPSDAQGMSAAVCELADRTYRNNWRPTLTRVLVQ